jgi:hypothetical protein
MENGRTYKLKTVAGLPQYVDKKASAEEQMWQNKILDKQCQRNLEWQQKLKKLVERHKDERSRSRNNYSCGDENLEVELMSNGEKFPQIYDGLGRSGLRQLQRGLAHVPDLKLELKV